MNVDNDFSIKQFLLSNGFEQTRDSDKRDNFKKTYFDPWEQKDKEILVTLYYQHGTNCFTEYIGGVMQVYSKVDLSSDSTTPNYVNIYNGLWPNNFDFALCLFRHILPGEEEFQDIENNIAYS